MSPGPLGPPASVGQPLSTLLIPWPFSSSPSPLSLSFLPLLFKPEDGPPDLGDSFLFLPLLPRAPFPTDPPLQLRLTLPSPLPSPRLCVLQSLPQTWLRPKLSWAVGLGSTASQGILRLPHPWLLPSRQARYCRWNSFGTTGPRVSGRWGCPPQGMGPPCGHGLAL